MSKYSAPITPGGAAAQYGTLGVDPSDMTLSHSAGSAGHMFSLSGGELRTDAAGYQLENGVLTVNAFSGEPQTLIEYSYDAAGLRTQKKVTENGITTTTDYFLHGKLLMHLKQGNGELHFFYDAQSRPQMLKYNGNYYSYMHNLQGDILAIVDSIGTQVVKYGYDAWGKPLGQPATLSSAATPIGTAIALSKLNPFRYRGYIYDDETGLYYLRSRYYNPEWGRFVNEDSLIGKTGRLLGHNMFAYCRNNPIALYDPSGRYFKDIWNDFWRNWHEYNIIATKVDAKMNIHAARNVINAGGRTALKALGVGKTAQDVFSHFLFGGGKDLSDETKTGLIKLIERSEAFQQKILSDSKELGMQFESSLEFPFKGDPDLNLAVGKARYQASLYRTTGGYLYADIYLTDTGDFDAYRIALRGFSWSNLANDVGYTIQSAGLSEPFDWSVRFGLLLN